MKSHIYKIVLGGSVALVGHAIASAPTFGQSPLSEKATASSINAANTLLRDGKVDEAIAAYHGIFPREQQRSELNYNLAVAEYRKGNIDEAERLFREVAGTSSPTLSSDSRYNLGNCQYSKALELTGNNKPAAIEHLRQAISNYRSSLRGDPNNSDARANIELAGELIRKLEKEQQQEEQQKQEQQQDKEEQSKEDKAETSQSQQSQSTTGESKEEKSQEDGERQQSDSRGSESDNKSEKQKKQDEASAPDQQKQDEQEQQTEGQGTPEEQETKNQQVPSGNLKAVEEQDDNKTPDGSAAMADPNAKNGLMTREEALKMLQAVRDRDMLRRLQQQRNERSRRVSVDRDW